ncbi:hypothetical protein BGZ52_008353, partial [Haplosporangium bisporale]
SSRSGSESPKKETSLEFISEFKNDSNAETSDDDRGIPDSIPDSDRFKRAKIGSSPLDAKKSQLSTTVVASPGRLSGVSSSSVNSPTKGAADMKLSLAEKLKQRMRQGLDQS